MKAAEILAIGDELLSGETIDTNSSYLDGVLEKNGWTVVRHTTVRDDLDDIAAVFREASARSDLVVSTGGLGPTQDDLTLEGLARALDCELVEHAETVARIEAMFRAMGREMTANNRRQAMVPAKGQVIANDAGTAPAFFVEHGRAKIFLMPGVPREVRWLVENRLFECVGRGDREIARRTIKVIGIGESKLEDMIKEVVTAHLSVKFGYRTQGIENHVKLFAEGPDREQLLYAAEMDLYRVLGDRIFGKNDDTLEEVVGRALRAAKATVATAESCTGGWIAKMLTDLSGSSEYVLGGVVTYSNDSKVRLLGVRHEDISEHGAVSEEVVTQMASNVRARLLADYGIGVTGIAGPTGGTEAKPVGTVWIAVASEEGVETQLLRLPVRSRDWIREMSARAALGLLRRKILGSGFKTTSTS